MNKKVLLISASAGLCWSASAWASVGYNCVADFVPGGVGFSQLSIYVPSQVSYGSNVAVSGVKLARTTWLQSTQSKLEEVVVEGQMFLQAELPEWNTILTIDPKGKTGPCGRGACPLPTHKVTLKPDLPGSIDFTQDFSCVQTFFGGF